MPTAILPDRWARCSRARTPSACRLTCNWLFNWAQATNAGFSRSGGTAPNLFEFDYFPDTGFGASIDATLIDTNIGFTYFYFTYDNRTLEPDVTYQVTLTHAAGATNISGQILTNGVLFTALPFSYVGPITDFRLDTLSISSYEDDGFGDSILAHGVVDNFVVTLPPPPVQNLTGDFLGNEWQCSFTSRTNWVYALEHSTNLVNWTAVVSNSPGVDGAKILSDTNPPASQAYYRIRAERP